MNVVVKRVYEAASRSDGVRVLVDRLWPRGLKKEDAAVQAMAPRTGAIGPNCGNGSMRILRDGVCFGSVISKNW